MVHGEVREGVRVGLDALAEITELMRRIRRSHPTAGLFEAADFQWWWAQRPRPTDTMPQLFWFDATGRPVAAVIATSFGDGTQLDPVVLPDAVPDWAAHVMTRGLSHVAAHGITDVTLEVDRTDEVLATVLAEHGLTVADDGYVEAWLATDELPAVSPLATGYRLASRADVLVTDAARPHHMTNAGRNHGDVESRLREVSLYRADLDLVVHAADGAVAGYGLFWYDPGTATGLVEPMRTEDEHQRRGIARHILTAGIDRLARAGAHRIKIGYEPANPGSGPLYRSVGFVPDRHTAVFAGPTRRVEGER